MRLIHQEGQTFEEFVDRITLFYEEDLSEGERLERPGECQHQEVQLCRRINKAGAVSVCYQCINCGAQTRVLSKAEKEVMSKEDRAALPLFDPELRDQAHVAYWAQHEVQQQSAKDGWWDRYGSYLVTEEWRAKRAKVLRRAGGTCEGCGDRPPRQVHHLTYIRLGSEMLFDLAALCLDCHQACHPGKEINAGVDD